MTIPLSQRPNPLSFLNAWTQENIRQCSLAGCSADHLAKKFMADAAAQGFVLAQFLFNEASLIRYIRGAMGSHRR